MRIDRVNVIDGYGSYEVVVTEDRKVEPDPNYCEHEYGLVVCLAPVDDRLGIVERNVQYFESVHVQP